MKNVLIVIDNLRIGGFQRLALDQSYLLSDNGFKVTIVVLDRESINVTLEHLERDLIGKRKIDILHIGGSKVHEVRLLVQVLRNCNYRLILSHSLRGTVELAIARKFTKLHKINQIVSTIHQLPTLSAPKQRFLRFTYAQYSDYLFAYSAAVKSDWEKRVEHFPKLFRLFYNKNIELLRNGIYLKRLPSEVQASSVGKPRLIYLGRLREWKGLTTYYDLGLNPHINGYDFLMMIPEIEPSVKKSLEAKFGDRMQFIVGKTIAHLQPRKGDVHIYPTNYGEDAEFVESISLNCLEFACIGIPSIVSRGGLDTWNDLKDYGIFCEVDWNDTSSVEKAIKSASINQNWDLGNIRKLISIDNNVMSLLQATGE